MFYRDVATSLLILSYSFAVQAAPPSVKAHVLILGDSLSEGFGVTPEESFPQVLQSRLQQAGYKDIKITNRSISGSTTASAVGRLEWALRAKDKPSVLLIALGGNDGLRGQPVSASRKNLATAIQKAKAAGLKVMLAGMQMPPNYGQDYVKEYRAMFKELAATEQIYLIPFLLDGVAAEKDLNLPDGIHPNPKGHIKIAELVQTHLLKVLADGTPRN